MSGDQNPVTWRDVLLAIIGILAPISGAIAYILKRWSDRKHGVRSKIEEEEIEPVASQTAIASATSESDPPARPFLAQVKHPYFNRAEELKQHLRYSFNLPNKGKELVFKDVLIANIDIRSDLLMKICLDVDAGFIVTSQELLSRHLAAFHQIIEQHQVYFYNKNYSSEEQKALTIVMDKFIKWHYKRIEYMPASFNSVCASIFYPDVKIQNAIMMDSHSLEMANTIQDGQMTLGDINGDLADLTFKGIRI